MSEHQVRWMAPSPLWPEAASAATPEARLALNQPAILRFAADSFMEDFLKIAETDPAQLNGLVAQPETWRGPTLPPKATALLEPAEPVSSFARKLKRQRLVAYRSHNGSALGLLSGPAAQGRPPATLKLYQPAHQRYYLVTACLVCGIVGLPDRALNAAHQERVSFVVRRLLPPTELSLKDNLPAPGPTWDEHALVNAPSGSGWQRIPKDHGVTPDLVVAGEEHLPLFPASFSEDDGRRRRLFAGLVPVGKREAYMGAARRDAEGEPAAEKKTDPRMMLFWSQVTEPWKRLIESAAAARKMQQGPAAGEPPSSDQSLPGGPNSPLEASKRATREQIQTVSWYVLLDFAKLLDQYVPTVWQMLIGRSNVQTPLVNALTNTTIPQRYQGNLSTASELLSGTSYTSADIQPSLRAALVAIRGGAPLNQQVSDDLERQLESVTTLYNRNANPPDPAWPRLLFPLADPVIPGPLPPPMPGTADDPTRLKDALNRIDELAKLIENELPVPPAEGMPATPIASQPLMDPREGWFVIRCVFERPNCGPLEPAIVSAPSVAFQMAGFFDPDAPARPIRIALPIDTSPAGLRKFDKNTAFMISDLLCGQIDRLKGLTLGDLVRSVLPWPLHKDLSVSAGGPCTDKNDPNLQAGMICSLSIPIITICALILLMIIVSLLDIIFRWIPYFLICFPLPGFRGKK
jgi:hypothetical protein